MRVQLYIYTWSGNIWVNLSNLASPGRIGSLAFKKRIFGLGKPELSQVNRATLLLRRQVALGPLS